MSRSVSVSSETSSVQYEEEPFAQFEHSRESPMSGPVVLTFRGSRRRTDAWGGGGQFQPSYSDHCIWGTLPGNTFCEFRDFEWKRSSWLCRSFGLRVIAFDLTRDNKCLQHAIEAPWTWGWSMRSRVERMSIVSQLAWYKSSPLSYARLTRCRQRYGTLPYFYFFCWIYQVRHWHHLHCFSHLL